jgi:predicted 3-demethylubiquinone-9 3-methyltransferase (glyoxalase superfamily)
MSKIAPCLWFDDKAEEAAKFYVSVFKNSKLGATTRYGPEASKASGRPEGSVMCMTFELEGQEFMALNGGPQFKFSEAISLMVNCETQAEIDKMWAALSGGGGSTSVCGWLKDRYGLSWQIVPKVMNEIMSSGDPAKINRVMAVVMQSTKPDIAALQRAYASQ